MSAVYTTTMTTPRLRVPRKTPSYSDQNRSSTATTDFAGPSRLPEISQLVDVDLHDMARSETSEQPTVTSKVSTPSTVTRAENPAAVLRALLSRLPNENRSPTPSQTPDQYPSERESDYDMSEHASATPSVAQEIVKDIFSKARRDPGDSLLKTRSRRNSVDTSEVESSRVAQYDRTVDKGKARSLSDDDNDETNMVSTSRSRKKSRSKSTTQPLTAAFLRERFSESFMIPGREDASNNSSNETATMLRDFDVSHASPPIATSTPQQSMRMSVNMDLHSNLLEQDTEMQQAIEGMDSYEGESSNNRSMSTPMFPRKGIIPTSNMNIRHDYADDDVDDGSHHTSSRSKPRYSLTPRPIRYGNVTTDRRPTEDSQKNAESIVHRSRSSHADTRTSHSDEERDEVEESLPSNIGPDHSFRVHNAGSQSFYDRQEVEESLKSEIDEEDNLQSHQSFMEQREVEESLQSGFDQDQSAYFPEARSQSFRERDEVEESLHDFTEHYNRNHRVEHSHEVSPQGRSRTPLQDAPSASRSRHSSATPGRASGSAGQGKTLDWDSVWQETSKAAPKSSTSSPQASFKQLTQGNITRPESRSQIRQSQRQQSDPSYASKEISPNHITHQGESRNAGSSQLSASHNSTLNRTSSLRAIDNTYHNDPSLRRPPSRTSSPLLSPSKKRPASPSVSLISTRKMKTSTVTSPNKHHESADVLQNNPSRSHSRSRGDFSSQPSGLSVEQDTYSSMSLTQIQQNDYDIHMDEEEPETDDAVPMDHSSRGEILRASSQDYTDMNANNSMQSGLTPRPASRQGSYDVPPGTPSLFLEENTPRREGASLPSTPPRRSTPKSARREYRTPSPPERLPELPTPSSSDEADASPVRNRTSKSQATDGGESRRIPTPKGPGGRGATLEASRDSTHLQEMDSVEQPRQIYPSTPANPGKYMNNNHLDTIGKTPKPPGGWFATPEPGLSHYTSEGVFEQHETHDNFSAIGKTPKPPGGWSATPAPGPSSMNRRFAGDGDSEQNAGLLTPMSTLSKGASLDPKTPGLPGGWLTTPAVRKSILKVRFNPETPAGPSDRLRQIDESPESSNYLQPSSSSPSALPLSPRSPRRSKASSIRVVDAFGREQESEPQSPNRSKSMLRIVDALGREVDVPDASSVEVDETKISRELPREGRRELFSRIRRGLDDLADDFGSTEEDEEDIASQKRIQELQAASEQARRAREKLKSGSTFINIPARRSSTVDSSPRPQIGWRFYTVTMIILLLSFLLMYWGICNHFSRQYFTTYYDPFNAELYGSDSKSFSHLFDPRLSNVGDTLSQVDGNPWYHQFPRAADILRSIWKLWEDDPISFTSSKNQWLHVPT